MNLDSFSSNSTSVGILPPPPSASKSKVNRPLKQHNNKLSPSQLCKFCKKNTIDLDENLKSFVLICSNCKNSNQSLDSSIELSAYSKNLSDVNSSTTSDNSRCSSTELYETIGDNSLAFEKLKPWEKLIVDCSQAREQDLEDESKHCLLNEEEEDSNRICLNVNNNLDSINYDSTNFELNSKGGDDDVWSMNDEQIKYYFNKFCQLLPPKSVKQTGSYKLAGNKVKSFFEKSKLNLIDLKQIWTLSDLDFDGSLTLVEFCIAMHLVVLRRNEIPLPEQLPTSLSPIKILKLLNKNHLNLNQTIEKLNEKCNAVERQHTTDKDSTDSLQHHVSINVSNDKYFNKPSE